MDKKSLLKLLSETSQYTEENGERYLLIDSLNLFFRNFSTINAVNNNGHHIGGVGGFMRSLGAMIKLIQPTKVYCIFDGIGSSQNRKNIITEYKSERHTNRITNWDVFEDLDDEDESKVNQIVRIIQYLKTLPVHTTSLDRAEADDIIAYISKKLIKSKNDKVFILSSDKDYLQLINKQIMVYRPIDKVLYTEDKFIEEYGIHPKNFILYKMLMGDNSDKITGVKGLGKTKLPKLFPELFEGEISFDDLINICENKLKEHIIYARILFEIDRFKDKFKIMDLHNPMLTEYNKMYLDDFITNNEIRFHPELFIKMYNEDQIGNLIRNVDSWLDVCFKQLK
jgi:DNA polymerase-1